MYLVLLDARQVPTEAQTDLTTLPVLQEQHRYTWKHIQKKVLQIVILICSPQGCTFNNFWFRDLTANLKIIILAHVQVL